MIDQRTFVYAIGCENGPVKVGITSNLLSRLRSLQNGSATKLDLIWVFTAHHRQEAVEMERWFHASHVGCRLEGEWFNITAEEAVESLDDQLGMAYGPFAKEFYARRNGSVA